MVENFSSVKRVISKIVSDIGEQAQFKWHNIKEWIGEVMMKISSSTIMIRGNACISITDYRALKPCNLVRTIAVTYKGCKLRYGWDIRNHTSARLYGIDITPIEDSDINKYQASNYDLIYKYDSNGKLIQTLSNNEAVNNMYDVLAINNDDYYYYIEGDWYKFNIEEGDVEIDFIGLYTDAEGFPMIPENSYLHEAIYYYVLNKMIGAGFTHPIFKGLQGFITTKQLFEEQFAMAKGTINFPSVEQMTSWHYAYNRLMPAIQAQDYYHHNTESRNQEPRTT